MDRKLNRRMETGYMILFVIYTTISSILALKIGDTLQLTCPNEGNPSQKLTWTRNEDKGLDRMIRLMKTNKPTNFVMPNLGKYVDNVTKYFNLTPSFDNVTRDFNLTPSFDNVTRDFNLTPSSDNVTRDFNLTPSFDNVTRDFNLTPSFDNVTRNFNLTPNFDNVNKDVEGEYKDWFYSMERAVYLTTNHIHVSQMCKPIGPNITNTNKVHSSKLLNISDETECINNTCRVDYLRCNTSGDCVPGVLECKLEEDIDETCGEQEDAVTTPHEKWKKMIAMTQPTTGTGTVTATATATTAVATMTPVPTSQPQVVTILIGALLGTLLLGGCIVLVVIQQLRKEKAKSAVLVQWRKKIIIEHQTLSGEDDHLKMPRVKIERERKISRTHNSTSDDVPMTEYELPPDNLWEFPRDSLTLFNKLGEGAFGKVVCAEAKGILNPDTSTTVAIKMLKENHSDAEVIDLVSEMELMKMIGKHVNIINLLGVKHAPLSMYNNAAVLSLKDLVSFAHQVATGMEYLHSKKCIHRDLAARNVLVSDNHVMKIADFGLAREIHSRDYYRKKTTGKIPIKWMAPESVFNSLYHYKSDVWSYGVLLWEIMTFGEAPYPSVDNMDIFLALLRNGHKMSKPDGCPEQVYTIMKLCWSYDASERPWFTELVLQLDSVLNVKKLSCPKMMTNALYVGDNYIETHPLNIGQTFQMKHTHETRM
ncbi:hypothetical protein WDU94_011984 [Cyamophila willieti]